MSYRSWHTLKMQYCHHAGCEVGLEGDAVYPAEHLPDQPPRLVAHRCSHAMECMLFNQPTCVWAGSNPLFDPFEDHNP